MKISFRLKELLEERQDDGRGIITRICEHTSLERHKVAALLANKVQYVSLETLASVCDYLIEKHRIPQDQLPGLLFGIDASKFWTLLTDRNYVEIAVGVRRDETLSEKRWVMAADSYLHGILLHELFGIGHEKQPDFLEQKLVPGSHPGSVAEATEDALRHAEAAYQEFHSIKGDRALVCLGSMKSNVLMERVVAEAFKANSFGSEDNVKSPAQRSCPFFFRYRQNDPKPSSCCGGEVLAQNVSSKEPGIYYARTPDHWELIPTDETNDAALVMYTYQPNRRVVEMVLAGFSSTATLCLGDVLRKHPDQLWPPKLSRGDVEIGVFLVHFVLPKRQIEDIKSDVLYVPTPVRTDIISLEADVLSHFVK